MTTYCTVYDHVLYRMYDFQIDALAREINQDDPYSHKRAAELDSTTVETYINSNMWMGGLLLEGCYGYQVAGVTMEIILLS